MPWYWVKAVPATTRRTAVLLVVPLLGQRSERVRVRFVRLDGTHADDVFVTVVEELNSSRLAQ